MAKKKSKSKSSNSSSPKSSSTTTTPTRAAPRKKRNLTNTNSDNLCNYDGPISIWMYRFNLWTGLYMLNPTEQVLFHIIFWVSIGVSLLYFSVFWSGFMEGVRSSSS
mmetsp:Transcript_13742/g.33286  ORF Transcript_13742/g.33286 Transcript_13742/m.33286 type:complete len:107 (-) Transcript_13742:164-484(-)